MSVLCGLRPCEEIRVFTTQYTLNTRGGVVGHVLDRSVLCFLFLRRQAQHKLNTQESASQTAHMMTRVSARTRKYAFLGRESKMIHTPTHFVSEVVCAPGHPNRVFRVRGQQARVLLAEASNLYPLSRFVFCGEGKGAHTPKRASFNSDCRRSFLMS